MKIEDLKKLGAFVDNKLVPCKIEWLHNGKEVSADFYVKVPSYAEMNKVIRASKSQDDVDPTSVIIASYIVDEDANSVFTYQQATSLKREIAEPLYLKCLEHMDYKEVRDVKKKLPTKKNSGAN